MTITEGRVRKIIIVSVLMGTLCGFSLVSQARASHVTVKEIRIAGNTYTKRSTVLHFLGFREGDKLELEDLKKMVERAEERLSSTWYFYDVNVHILPPSKEDKRVILIKLDEGYLWRFGGGSVFAYVGRDNLFGRGEYLGMRLGTNVQSLEYENPIFRAGRWAIGGEIHHIRADSLSRLRIENQAGAEESFQVGRAGGSSHFGYYLNPDLRVGLRFNFDWLDFKEKKISISDPQELGIDSDKYLFIIDPSLEWSTRSSRFSPTHGFYLKLGASLSRKVMGSDFDFDKYSLEARKYFHFGGKHILATRLLFGGSSSNLPYFELYDLTGIDGLRASGYDQYFGEKVVLVSAEHRVSVTDFFLPPIFNVGVVGVFFLDLGRTWDKDEEVDLGDLRTAFGPGIRFHFGAPIFVDLRLEYGFGGKEGKLYVDTKVEF